MDKCSGEADRKIQHNTAAAGMHSRVHNCMSTFQVFQSDWFKWFDLQWYIHVGSARM